jgi:hypothetical protein
MVRVLPEEKHRAASRSDRVDVQLGRLDGDSRRGTLVDVLEAAREAGHVSRGTTHVETYHR